MKKMMKVIKDAGYMSIKKPKPYSWSLLIAEEIYDSQRGKSKDSDMSGFSLHKSHTLLVLRAKGQLCINVCDALQTKQSNKCNLTRASATAASTSMPVFRMRIALTEADIRA